MTPTDADRERARQLIALIIHKQWLFELVGGSRGNREEAAKAVAAAFAEARRGTIEECERIAFSYGGNENSASRRIAERIRALAAPDQGKPTKDYFDVQPPGDNPQKIG